MTTVSISAKLLGSFTSHHNPMTAPRFYLVANEDAFILDNDGVTVYGAPVNEDGTVDFECAFDFDPCEEDVEYVAYMSKYLIESAKMYHETNVAPHSFIK